MLGMLVGIAREIRSGVQRPITGRRFFQHFQLLLQFGAQSLQFDIGCDDL